MSRWQGKNLREDLDRLLDRHGVRVGGHYRLSDARDSTIYRREMSGTYGDILDDDVRRLIDSIRRNGLWRY